MTRSAVEVTVGGQVYRLVASAGEQTLRRCARIVDERLRQLTPNDRSPPPQALLLVAMALAHDLEEERGQRRQAVSEAEAMLRRLLSSVDAALDGVDENGNELSSVTSG